MRQKNQVELNLGTGAEGEARSAAAREPEACTAKACLERPAVAGPSMEDVVERENLKTALAQVKRNKGAAGIDDMSVDDLPKSKVISSPSAVRLAAVARTPFAPDPPQFDIPHSFTNVSKPEYPDMEKAVTFPEVS